MTRISSLFVATTLAILPISAFAQQDAAPAKVATPTGTISTAPATATDKVVAGKTETAPPAKTAGDLTQTAKPAAKTGLMHTKTELHGMNTVKSHDGKMNAPASSKIADPTKS